MHTSDLKEVEEKLKIFKTAKIEENKTIVLVSNVMVWVNTPTKYLKQAVNPVAEDYNEPNEGTEEKKDNSLELQEDKHDVVDELKEEIKEIPFEDLDYLTRVPHKDYEAWKSIEDLVLELGSKENLNVYVICAGVLYGNGEKVFEDHFKSAWLEDPPELGYLGDGNNLIPTIHVRDLAKIIKFVVDTKPETHYIFGIDNTKDRRQVSIVQSISNGIGTGLIKSIVPQGKPWEQFLSIHVWLKPSVILIPEEEAPSPIEWHSIGGIPGNIHKLNTEFNTSKGLKPIKIFVSGPPASGKTHFSRVLDSEYNIPHIKVHDLITEYLNKHPDPHDEIKELVQSNQRIPDDLLSQIFNWKLNMNHCRNRGYILDGYPKTYQDALMVFKKEKKTDTEAHEDTDEIKSKDIELNTFILPESVVIFRASNQFLLNRIEKLSHSSEFNQDRMQRRLREYRENNDLADKSIFEFFSELGIEIYECEVTYEEVEIIESLKIYIERSGRPFNFLASIQETEETRRKYIEQRDLDIVLNAQNKILESQEGFKKIQKEREDLARKRFLDIKKKLEDVTDARSISLRKYLMDNVMPTMAEALIQVCKVMPEDPVDYLAELIYSHSKRYRKK